MKRILSAALFLVLILVSCDTGKREAFGSYYNIFVLTGGPHSDQMDKLIERHLQKTIATPGLEDVFRFFFVDSTTFLTNLERRNLVVATTIDAEGFAGDLARQMLSDEAIERVRKGGSNLFVKEDVWAEGQTFGLIVGTDAEMLAWAVETEGSNLANIFDDRITELLASGLFADRYRYDERKLEEKIENEYGFHVGVPTGFVWEKGSPADDFLWLRHLAPEKWLFVHRMPLDQAYAVTGSTFAEFRDSICAIWYEGDIVDSLMTIEEEFVSNGLPGWRINGLWANTEAVLGGPFQTYVLDDSTAGIRYTVDGAIFAPGVKKERFFRHVEVMLSSFRPLAQY
mgnify:CR=1 FL=1